MLTISVIGTGAIGGYYGAKLARGGQDVHFLLHRDYEYVKEHGLYVTSCDGDFRLDITSGRDDRVRIGTTQCLTAEQCRHITLNGARVIQDREGYLTLMPMGTMILFR